MRKTLGGLWLACALALPVSVSIASAVQAAELAEYLQPDHPQSYTVVSGDTLWDISGRFLTAPWLWPELWRANQQINNPHLIYPGDVIHLVYVDGQPTLSLERGAGGRDGSGGGGRDGSGRWIAGSDRLEPRIREEATVGAIPAIRLDAIEAFLAEHRVVDAGALEAAPYVLAGENKRIVLGAGDRFYAKGAIGVGDVLGIYRPGEDYRDPQTGELLGTEATDVGVGRSLAIEDGVSTIYLSRSREEVRRGDRLMSTDEARLQSSFFPNSPEKEVRGNILAVHAGVTQVGKYDVVILSRGARDGLSPGNVMAIYQRGELVRDVVSNDSVRLPSERAGLAMVFRTFEKLSYALVLKAERPLAVMDEVRNP